MEEEFYATIKLKTGEEIFCKVSASEEEQKTMLIISNPIVISEIKTKYGVSGYKIEPWLKTTTEDTFIVDIENVLTMSESIDMNMIKIYEQYIQKEDISKLNTTKLNRKMGYVGNVNEAKKILENLYKNS